MSIYVPGMGNPSAKLFFIGDSPGKSDEERQQPFSGGPGSILDSVLQSCGTHRSEVYTSNIWKYKLAKWESLTKEQIESGLESLGKEIESINPTVLIPMGENAFKCITGLSGLTKWRGSILSSIWPKYKAIPTYHPAHLSHTNDGNVRKYYQKFIIQADIAKSIRESRQHDKLLPNPRIILAKNSLDLFYWIKETKGLRTSVDIEATYCLPATIAFSCPPWTTAIVLPLIKRMALQETWTDIEFVHVWKMIQSDIFSCRPIIGQNFKFDDQKMDLYGFRIKNVWFDTLFAGHALYPELPRNLGFFTSLYTRMPYYKDEGKAPEDLGKHFNLKTWLEYNGKDAIATGQVADGQLEEIKERGMQNFFFHHSMPNHTLYKEMEENGFDVDKEEQQRLLKQYTEWEKESEAKIQAASGLKININSHLQVKQLLYEHLNLPARWQYDRKKGKSVLKSDEDTIVALLANNVKTEKQKICCEEILNIRKIRKAISTYILAIPDYDGKMRTSYFICGTETGRSSTQKLDPPTRMLVTSIDIDEETGKKKKKKKGIGTTFQNQTKHGRDGKIRKMYRASPGYILINCDFSQAEPRIVAVLAKDLEWQSDFANGIDTHAKAASFLFGKDWFAWSKKAHGGHECPERFIGKTVRNAFNYRTGKRELMRTVNTGAKKASIAVDISEWKAGQFLDTFERYSPFIKSVFQYEIEECVRQTRMLRNPFGRERLFLERMDDRLLGEAFAQIPQSTVPDALRVAMRDIKIEYPPMRYIVECHDAFTAEVPEKEGLDIAKMCIEKMKMKIDMSRCSLPRDYVYIPAEAEIGYNYLEMESVK